MVFNLKKFHDMRVDNDLSQKKMSDNKVFKCNYLYDSLVTSKRLKKVRLNNKLSQEQIASLLNIPQRTYSSYERYDRKIPLEFLFNFACKFEVSIDYLTGRKNTDV